MIVCPRCSKENQDHYKFCLGCGAELPREAAAPRNFSARTPPSAMPAVNAPPMAAASVPPREAKPQEKNLQFAATQQGDVSYPPPRASVAQPAPIAAPAPAPAPARVPSAPAPAPVVSAVHNCPSCGNPVPLDFKFCGTCGHRMTPAAAAAPAPAPVAAPAAAPGASARPSRGMLVLINPDGSEGDSFPLCDGATAIGREAGALFAGDAYLSPLHATFAFSGPGCSVKDESSLNGVYIKLRRDVPVKLGDTDVFRIGQEILRFEAMHHAAARRRRRSHGQPEPGLHRSDRAWSSVASRPRTRMPSRRTACTSAVSAAT